MRTYNSGMLRGIRRFSVVVLAAVCLAGPTLGAGRDAMTSRQDVLVRQFNESVFTEWTSPTAGNPAIPYKSDAIVKWRGPLRFAIIHETGSGYPLSWENDYDAFIGFLSDLSAELSRLTGLPIIKRVEPSALGANATLLILGGDQMRQVHEKFTPSSLAALGSHGLVCAGWPRPDDDGSSALGHLVMQTGLSKELARHCIVKSVLQMLGLEGVGGRRQNSRDRIDGQPLYPLSFETRLMLRTLYDPRITPGMAKGDAVAQARVIIAELLRAVDRHGEAALYQR